jgi:hypothetical protein
MYNQKPVTAVIRYIVTPLHRIDDLTVQQFNGSTLEGYP